MQFSLEYTTWQLTADCTVTYYRIKMISIVLLEETRYINLLSGNAITQIYVHAGLLSKIKYEI